MVRGLLRSPTGKLDMRVARIPPIGAWSRYLKGTSAHVALELTHVEPVDQRSGTRKADEVWHFWERPGQRHDALKRVAQTPACRLLFLVGVKHVRYICCGLRNGAIALPGSVGGATRPLPPAPSPVRSTPSASEFLSS